MANQRTLHVGTIDCSVAMIISDASELLVQFPYVLVTSIDSIRNLNELGICKTIRPQHHCECLSKHLILFGKDLPQIQRQLSLFHGFDEVWFFSQQPRNPIPTDFWIVGPREIVSDIPDGLAEWMQRNHCQLGLGDGTGLNYVTLDARIAEALRTFEQT